MSTSTWALPLAAVALLLASIVASVLRYQRRAARRPRRERVYLHQARVAAHRRPSPHRQLASRGTYGSRRSMTRS